MSLAMNKNANPEATPDQLLTILELQIAAQRRQRRARAHSRPLLVAGSLLLIFSAAIVAFFVLHGMLADVARNGGESPVSPAAEVVNGGNF
jgi:hypothetical protein